LNYWWIVRRPPHGGRHLPRGTVEAVSRGYRPVRQIGAERKEAPVLHASDLIEGKTRRDRPITTTITANGGGKRVWPTAVPARPAPAANIAGPDDAAEAKRVQVHQRAHKHQGSARHDARSPSPAVLVYMRSLKRRRLSKIEEQGKQRAKLRESGVELVPKEAGAGGGITETVAEDLKEQSCKRESNIMYGPVEDESKQIPVGPDGAGQREDVAQPAAS